MNYDFNWQLVLTGEYADWIIKGFFITLKISAISIVFAMLLGTMIAVSMGGLLFTVFASVFSSL